MSVCSVRGCPSANAIRIYRAPTGFNNEIGRRVWYHNIGKTKTGKTPNKHTMVCQRHFVDGRPTPQNRFPILHMGHDDVIEKVTLETDWAKSTVTNAKVKKVLARAAAAGQIVVAEEIDPYSQRSTQLVEEATQQPSHFVLANVPPALWHHDYAQIGDPSTSFAVKTEEEFRPESSSDWTSETDGKPNEIDQGTQAYFDGQMDRTVVSHETEPSQRMDEEFEEPPAKKFIDPDPKRQDTSTEGRYRRPFTDLMTSEHGNSRTDNGHDLMAKASLTFSEHGYSRTGCQSSILKWTSDPTQSIQNQPIDRSVSLEIQHRKLPAWHKTEPLDPIIDQESHAGSFGHPADPQIASAWITAIKEEFIDNASDQIE